MFWRSRGERHAALALALALALAPRVEGGLYATDGPVVTIRPYQLHAIRTDPQRAWVVEAYASWCGHCQAFAPTFEALARNLSAYHEVVGVGAIDCAVDTAACIAIGVTGYPTLFVWGKGTPFNATAEPPSPSPSPPLPLVRMGKPAIAELEETASDGAPMHDGGFVSEDELFDWLLPKLPRLYLTLPDATTAASAAAAASARNESLALFWPSELGGSGDSETAQRLALDFAGRALFGQLAHPADALAALGLADQFLTSQLAPEPVSRLARARAPAAALRAAASGETEDRLAPTLLVFNRPAMLAAAAAHVSTAASNVAAEAAAAAEVAMAERDAGSGGLRALAAAATAGLTRTLREKALPAQDPPRLTLTQRLAAARAARKENANATVARPPPAAAKPRAAAAKPAAAPAPVTRPTATALVPAGASPGYVAYTASFAALAPVETWLRRILPPRPAAPAPPSPSPSAAELVVVGAGPVEASLVDLCAAVEFAFASDVPLAIGGGGAGGALGGDGLIALRAFLRLLTAAFPAVANRRALEGVRAAVETAAASGNLTAAQWANATRGFALPEPAASASARAAARGRAWVQCAGSRAELRGYPCSLWLLFHALLANADAGPAPADAAPPSGSASSAALGAITGYVRHFFGCLECRAHFVTMAANLTQDVCARARAASAARRARARDSRARRRARARVASLTFQFPCSLSPPAFPHARSRPFATRPATARQRRGDHEARLVALALAGPQSRQRAARVYGRRVKRPGAPKARLPERARVRRLPRRGGGHVARARGLCLPARGLLLAPAW
jgi:thiol-disulfide isomerase/thioredoxin